MIDLPVTVEENTLVFESEQDLQKCLDLLKEADIKQLDDFEKTLNFESYRTSHKGSIDEDDPNFSDELFLSIINPNAEIIVAQHVLRVDFDNEKTIVAPVNSNNSLKSGSSITFDWDEDIFEYLETGKRNLLKRKKKYCTSDKEKEHYMGSGTDMEAFKIKAKVCFQRFGWYNSIIIKMKQTVGNNSSFPVHVWYNTVGPYHKNSFYKRKNEKEQYFDRSNSGYFNGYENEISHRPYGPSTKRLKAYKVEVKFQASFLDITDSKVLLISCSK